MAIMDVSNYALLESFRLYKLNILSEFILLHKLIVAFMKEDTAKNTDNI